jgi:16S rRNA (uracil1498-N3)-methyltransferase
VAGTPSLLYVPDLGASGTELALPHDEAHYVARVCRARAGDTAEATDGRGTIARLRLIGVGAEVRAEVLATERVERRRGLSLWCGAPERGRADWLVEKLAELGVERFQPLECAGEPWPGGARNERWQRLAVAALRQSRRAYLMEIGPPLEIDAALATIENATARWVGDPAGRPAGAVNRPDGMHIGAIGPSGGFGAGERRRLAEAEFEPVCLAEGRLRTETAALSLAAWWAVPTGG